MQVNGEATTRDLGILTRLIKLFVTHYKEDNRRYEYFKHQKIKRWYGKINHKNQV